MQSFFCLGSLFNIFLGNTQGANHSETSNKTGTGFTWKGDAETTRDMWERPDRRGGGGYFVFRGAAHTHPPLPHSVREWHAIMSGPAPSQRSLKLLHHLAVPLRWERHREREGGGEEKERDNQPSLANPPNPSHNIKYHEIISVISMEICLQIINAPSPPPLSVHNLFI